MKSFDRFLLVVALLATPFFTLAAAAPALPPNLGGGLRELLTEVARQPPQARSAATVQKLREGRRRLQSDAAGRVVVDVYLNGLAPESEVRAALVKMGARVLAAEPAGRSSAARHGVISAYVPVARLVEAAGLPGVQSVMGAHRPYRRVGTRTAQGVATMKVLPVHRRGFRGAGITVGAISDSYDVTEPFAAQDVLRGDLPGLGNRAKNTTPVNVLLDADSLDTGVIDEGRAMLQIIHDVAPQAALAFCAVGETQTTFADAIRRLRTEGNCDVIVDDIGFPEEPMFSDGIVTQAVEDVVNSTTLAGKRAIYYAAAGNEGSFGYDARFTPISDSTARSTGGGSNLQLAGVPASLTGGGFHNFSPTGVDIAQRVTVSGTPAEITLQWNDLFDPAEMTADYNLLIFDENGNFLETLSGTDDAFATGNALEFVDLDSDFDGGEVVYQIAITRRAGGTGEATHIRYFEQANQGLGGEYFTRRTPTIFGHSGSRSGDSVGAYFYKSLAAPQDFSSFGPATIYFDDQGNRLSTPEERQQPTISAPDGVSTSMVNFRPFFGTSAAAPHAAGVAALLLQAMGGPGSLTASEVRQALQATTFAHDLDPQSVSATATGPGGTVTVRADGDGSEFSASWDRFFTLSYTGPSGTTLNSVIIDLTRAGLKFDADPVLGQPFVVGEISAGATAPSAEVLRGNRRLQLTFTNFPSGSTVRFGIDRDLARSSSAGNAAQSLLKATVTANLLPGGETKPVRQVGTFVDLRGTGYTPADGFGMINVDAALKSLGK